MAVANGVVWEIRTTGSSTNGGGFNPAASGTDYSQQDTAQYTATSVLTSAGAGNTVLWTSAAADMVGNTINISGGTNFTVGFFEITSVSVGVSITCSTNQAGASITTGVGASGSGKVGGAFKFGTSTDNTFSVGVAPGNTIWIKAGSYPTQTISMQFTDATATHQSSVLGYNTSRGDNPTGSSRPVLTTAGTSNLFGTLYVIRNIISTGTATTPWATDGQCVVYNCKFTNTSQTTGRSAFNPSDDLLINCEFVSYNGNAVNSSGSVYVEGCYIHDSINGIRSTATGSAVNIINNIIATCGTNAITLTGANTELSLIYGNTVYGAEAKISNGLLMAANNSNTRVVNNIFYGLVTGINATTTNIANFTTHNDFFNNTTNVTNWTTGLNSQTINPTFVNTTTVGGTAGTVSGSTLTDASANFSNVVDNQDFLVITSGTGVTNTPGALLITSHTTTSVTVSQTIGGSGTNIIYNVRTGHNFTTGPGLKNVGFPSLFPGTASTSFVDIGAIQQYSSSGGNYAWIG